MTGVDDTEHRAPAQRVRPRHAGRPAGALGAELLHGAGLPTRVYGPELTLRLCASAAADGPAGLLLRQHRPRCSSALRERPRPRCSPASTSPAREPSKFRTAPTAGGAGEIADRIRASGARSCFVGLGCPRQEVFAYEHARARCRCRVAGGRRGVRLPRRAPCASPRRGCSARGLQWLYRLAQDPRRLWRRYLLLNPDFLARLVAQKLHLWRPDLHSEPPTDVVGYG